MNIKKSIIKIINILYAYFNNNTSKIDCIDIISENFKYTLTVLVNSLLDFY